MNYVYRPEQAILLRNDHEAETPFLPMDGSPARTGPRFRSFRLKLNRRKSRKKQTERPPLQLLPPVVEEPSESNKRNEKHLYNSVLNHLRTHLIHRNSNRHQPNGGSKETVDDTGNNDIINVNNSKNVYDTTALPPSLLAQLIQLTKLRAAIQRAQRNPKEATYVAGNDEAQFPIHMLMHVLMKYNQEQQELLDASHVNTLFTTLLIAHPVAAYQADATGLIPALQATRHDMITTATINLILLTNPAVLEQREPVSGKSLKDIQEEAQPDNTELATLLSQPAEMWYSARKAVSSRLQQTSCIRVPTIVEENDNAGAENVNDNGDDDDDDDALTHNPFFDYAGRDDATIISATTAALMPHMPPKQTISVPASVATTNKRKPLIPPKLTLAVPASVKTANTAAALMPHTPSEQQTVVVPTPVSTSNSAIDPQALPTTMEENIFGKTTHHTTNKLQDKIRVIQQRQQQQQQERIQHMTNLIEFTLGVDENGTNGLSMLGVQSVLSKAVHEHSVQMYEELFAEHASSDAASLDTLQTKLKDLLVRESSVLFSSCDESHESFFMESTASPPRDDRGDSDNSDENVDDETVDDENVDADTASVASVYKDEKDDDKHEAIGEIGEKDDSEKIENSYESGHQIVEDLGWISRDKNDSRDDSHNSSHGDPELFHYDDDTAAYTWSEHSGHDFSDHTECETNADDLTAIIHAAAASMAKGKDSPDLDAIGNDDNDDDEDDDYNYTNYTSTVPAMKTPIPAAMMTMVNDNLDAMLKFAAEQEFSDQEQSERSCEQLAHLIQEVAQSAGSQDNDTCIDEDDMDQSVGLRSDFGGQDDCWSVADAVGI